MTAAIPPSELTDHVGYWLRQVSNHVSQAFARKVEAHGVTVAEWVLMRQLLGEDRLPPSQIAERMGMTRGAVTKLADRLITKSLLVREADPEDGRAQTLALTPKGRKLVPKLAALADANDAEFFDLHLTKSDRAALLRILRRIAETRALKSPPID
ncbi:MAG TPA: MarR family transcriptional regulator [Rhizomicrobium sp.]|jgi:DNA-binding MarR family transcriptional regulator|nr:MarR family transcriptional regulator [Rhizomicrobium sp.]